MIYPYRTGSKSVNALSEKMNMKRIKREGSAFKGRQNKLVINWGAKAVSDEVKKCKVLNDPAAVELASNKLTFFKHVHEELNVPEFTTDKGEAYAWVEEGKTVVVREILNGHSGQGIVLLEDENDFDLYNHENAKLYVKYIPKKQEYRVHVVGNEAIDVRRKALKSDVNRDHVNWKIRNLDNGFIFSKDGFEAPQDVIDQAIRACQLCNLDFGAVDIVFNDFQKKAYVIEVNTAPGLEGSTVDNYSAAFEKLFSRHNQASKLDDVPDELYNKYLHGTLTMDELIMAYEAAQSKINKKSFRHAFIEEPIVQWGE